MTYPCGCSTIPKPSLIPSTDQAQVRGCLFFGRREKNKNEEGKRRQTRKGRGICIERNSISTIKRGIALVICREE